MKTSDYNEYFEFFWLLIFNQTNVKDICYNNECTSLQIKFPKKINKLTWNGLNYWSIIKKIQLKVFKENKLDMNWDYF